MKPGFEPTVRCVGGPKALVPKLPAPSPRKMAICVGAALLTPSWVSLTTTSICPSLSKSPVARTPGWKPGLKLLVLTPYSPENVGDAHGPNAATTAGSEAVLLAGFGSISAAETIAVLTIGCA